VLPGLLQPWQEDRFTSAELLELLAAPPQDLEQLIGSEAVILQGLKQTRRAPAREHEPVFCSEREGEVWEPVREIVREGERQALTPQTEVVRRPVEQEAVRRATEVARSPAPSDDKLQDHFDDAVVRAAKHREFTVALASSATRTAVWSDHAAQCKAEKLSEGPSATERDAQNLQSLLQRCDFFLSQVTQVAPLVFALDNRDSLRNEVNALRAAKARGDVIAKAEQKLVAAMEDVAMQKLSEESYWALTEQYESLVQEVSHMREAMIEADSIVRTLVGKLSELEAMEVTTLPPPWVYDPVCPSDAAPVVAEDKRALAGEPLQSSYPLAKSSVRNQQAPTVTTFKEGSVRGNDIFA
jgi:gas vesicle protein